MALTKLQQDTYHGFVGTNNITDSLGRDICTTCQPPTKCGQLNELCNSAHMLSVIRDQKQRELFLKGYAVLSGNDGVLHNILSFTLTLLNHAVSTTDMKQTMLELANVVINQQEITWDILSKLHQFLVSSHVGWFVGHDDLMVKLNKQVVILEHVPYNDSFKSKKYRYDKTTIISW